MATLVLAAFLMGVAVCYVFAINRLTRTVDETYWDQLETLKYAEEILGNTHSLLDDTKHIQDQLNPRHKAPSLEQTIGLLLLNDDWEIDTLFDDISGQTTAFVNETDIPADFAFNVELDESLTYTIVAPKRVLFALKRVLGSKAAQQAVSSLPYSTRPFMTETKLTAKSPNVAEPVIINPALTAAAQQHTESPK
jgi:hypothetical protein